MSAARPTRSASRRGLLVAVVAAVVWLVLPDPVASAHATLLASSPPSGYAVATAPAELSLDFDQPVTIGAAPMQLVDTAGKTYPLGAPVQSLGGRRLSEKVLAQLAVTGYRIRWRVTADDGDLVSGTISFAVGTGAAPTAAPTDSVDSPWVIGLRWLLFAGLFLALGSVAGDVLVGRVAAEARRDAVRLDRPRPWSATGALAGTVAAVGLALDQAGLAWDRLATGAGLLLAVEVAGFGSAFALAVLIRREGRWIRAVKAAPLLAVVAAEGLRAHPHADAPVFGTALTVLHLLAAGVWVGALVHVLRTARAWRGRAGWTRLLVHDYARLALVLVALVIGTGAAEALIVLPSVSSLVTTLYGAVLLAKLLLVAVAVVAAWLGRSRLHRSRRTQVVPALGRGGAGRNGDARAGARRDRAAGVGRAGATGDHCARGSSGRVRARRSGRHLGR